MTTLTEARHALLKLVNTLPVPSTYASHLAVLSDYFDNQVPLNIENNNLLQRMAVAEGFVAKVREMLPPEEAISDDDFARAAFKHGRDTNGTYGKFASAPPARTIAPGMVDCTAYRSGVWRCACPACRVRANA